MLVTTAVFALLGYLKVRRIRGPQETIASVKETTAALTPGNFRPAAVTPPHLTTTEQAPADPSGW